MSRVRSSVMEIKKRLKKLEANRKMESDRIVCSPAGIERAALGKLSAADRHLLQSKGTEGSKDTQEYKDLLTRWNAALTAASREAGIICLSEEEMGWL